MRRSDSGIALITVLWGLLLVSSLATAALFMVRTNAVLTHRALDLARARAAADAALEQMFADLADEHVERHPPVNGSVREQDFDGIQVSVRASRESGRIDLNTGDDQLILALLRSSNVDPERAEIMLDELRDWQDPDNTPREHGAEVMTYRQRRWHTAPRNGPLETVEELRQIPSWNTVALDCLVPSITVYTGLKGVTSADAGTAVHAALQYAQDHHLGDHDWIGSSNVGQDPFGVRSVVGEVLRIQARAVVSTDVTATVEWVGRLTGDRRAPTLTMRWNDVSETSRHECPLAVAPVQ